MIDYSSCSFTYDDSPVHNARVGTLSTPHGTLTTPNFIFCGTKASIKGLPALQVKNAGAEIILANTYHLMIYPGADHIATHGGLHRFMNWQGPMLTDSGGYQVFAMGHGSVSSEIKKGNTRTLPKSLLAISEEGVSFKSYLNGEKVFLSPETSIEIQKKLGADLLMQFDECTPFHVDKNYTDLAMQRSLRWGERSLQKFEEITQGNQAMYGIIQGGVYEDLRKISSSAILSQDFWGTAIGGSLGAHKSQMYDIVALTASLIRSPRPIHLLGIGDIPDIFWGITQGIDTFDCVHPTRIARHACAIVPGTIAPTRKINLKNSRYSLEDVPIDPHCTQICCTHHSRAYIHHLFKAKELLGMYLLTLHNVAQMSRLMKDIQKGLTLATQTQSSAPFDEVKHFWMG